jgi:hypothetical protein
MIVKCISVLPLRVPYRDKPSGYVVSYLRCIYLDNDPSNWCLCEVAPTVYQDSLQAELACATMACEASGPWLTEIEHNRTMNVDDYRAACKSQGLKCDIPEPTPEPAPHPEEGAPA